MRFSLLVIAALTTVAVPAAADVPDGLDRAAITAGIQAVMPKVRACGDKVDVHGVVKIHARVAPDGTVSAATAKAAPDAALGECVARAVAGATFSRSRSGASFSYPFRF